MGVAVQTILFPYSNYQSVSLNYDYILFFLLLNLNNCLFHCLNFLYVSNVTLPAKYFFFRCLPLLFVVMICCVIIIWKKFSVWVVIDLILCTPVSCIAVHGVLPIGSNLFRVCAVIGMTSGCRPYEPCGHVRKILLESKGLRKVYDLRTRNDGPISLLMFLSLFSCRFSVLRDFKNNKSISHKWSSSVLNFYFIKISLFLLLMLILLVNTLSSFHRGD